MLQGPAIISYPSEEPRRGLGPLPGYAEAVPMVYCGLFPTEADARGAPVEEYGSPAVSFPETEFARLLVRNQNGNGIREVYCEERDTCTQSDNSSLKIRLTFFHFLQHRQNKYFVKVKMKVVGGKWMGRASPPNAREETPWLKA